MSESTSENFAEALRIYESPSAQEGAQKLLTKARDYVESEQFQLVFNQPDFKLALSIIMSRSSIPLELAEETVQVAGTVCCLALAALDE